MEESLLSCIFSRAVRIGPALHDLLAFITTKVGVYHIPRLVLYTVVEFSHPVIYSFSNERPKNIIKIFVLN